MFYKLSEFIHIGHPHWLSNKEFACNAGDTDSVPGLGRSPGGGKGKLPQDSCLK